MSKLRRFQQQVRLVYPRIGDLHKRPKEVRALILTTKLAGEVGELCEEVSKPLWYEGHMPDCKEKSKFRHELHDVLFTLTALSEEMGLELEDMVVEAAIRFKAKSKKFGLDY